VEHCRQRQVGGRSLFSYDQVQQRIAHLQTAYTICSAMCLNSSRKAGVDNNLATQGLEANTTKTHVTDLMQEAAQSLLQLVGAKGYRLNHIAGRALVDSRPFQIFEGSNDILYIQIAEAVQKQMQRTKETNLLRFCQGHELTERAAEPLGKILDFALQAQMAQRKLTEFGRLFSRVVSLNLIQRLADSGFRPDLIRSAAINLEQEISALTSGYRQANNSAHIDDYQTGGNWFECLHNP